MSKTISKPTAREQEIIELDACGYGEDEIAAVMNMTEDQVAKVLKRFGK